MTQARKYDADQEIQDIEVVIGGKSYFVKEVTEAKLDQVSALGKTAAEGSDVTVLSKQLALLVDVDENTFHGVDIRKLMGAVNFIQRQITESAGDVSKKA